jgi:hypothetical protein
MTAETRTTPISSELAESPAPPSLAANSVQLVRQNGAPSGAGSNWQTAQVVYV